MFVLTIGLPIAIPKQTVHVQLKEPIFYLIVGGGSLGDIRTELRQNPGLVNGFEHKGNSLLCYAAQEGRLEVVQLLLEMGASPNGRSDLIQAGRGDPPLTHAISCGHADIVKLLLEAGADPSLKRPGDLSPMDLAIYSRSKPIRELLGIQGNSPDNNP